MNRRSLFIAGVIAVFFLLSSVFVFAQEGEGNKTPCGCADGNLIRDEGLERWAEESMLCYETEDGNLYWWLQSYNDRVRSYEKNGDTDGIVCYLRKIADNYGFGDESDEEGFIEWVLETRPWEEE